MIWNRYSTYDLKPWRYNKGRKIYHDDLINLAQMEKIIKGKQRFDAKNQETLDKLTAQQQQEVNKH